MQTKEYKGKILRLEYPGFLRVERGEPEWYAVGPEGRTTVLLNVAPEPALAEGFARLIRNPHFTKSGGTKIDREGQFKTAKGIEGYERVTRLVNALGAIETRGWLVDGKFCGRHVLNIQITTVDQDWYNGMIWEAFLNSIDVIGGSEEAAIELPQPKVKQNQKPNSKPEDQKEGILAELPKRLEYLRDLAFDIGSLSPEDLEDNPELPKTIERHLSRKMAGLPKEEARSRVKVDREQLWDWLKQYPAGKHPETAGLHVVVGALQYADGIFK